MSMTETNRRRFTRFTVQPMYTPIAARLVDAESEAFDIEGHAYDVSEGGIRFELDRLVEPGTKIAMKITLPTMHNESLEPGRSILVYANVVWVADREDPPPVRTAAVFTEFVRVSDRERLLRHFGSGYYRHAA